MNQGDTIRMNSAFAEYNGNTQKAFASGDVVLNTPDNTLTTDTLYFNRIKQESFYDSGGKVRDSSSTITSKIGRYFIQEKKYVFKQNVVVNHPEYILETIILPISRNQEQLICMDLQPLQAKTAKFTASADFINWKKITAIL